jgi:hypothetical protein
LIATRRAERQNGGDGSRKHPTSQRRQANMHNVDLFVNLDDLIDYTLFHHGIHDSIEDIALDKDNRHKEEYLLPYLAARGNSDTYPGDIRRVLAHNHAQSHKKAQNTPDTVTVSDVKYYLSKDETIAVYGQHYSAHMAVVQYCIEQHDITTMDKALIDRGTNGGICGADTMVLEGSDC